MKNTFLIGVVLGFAGLLAGVGRYPWIEHTRLASKTQVVPNGGRAEQFLIRLPADRLAGFTADDAPGAERAARPGAPALLSIEQFKIRDRDGRVIGVAARHRTDLGDRFGIAWVLSIPSRGALMLADSAGPRNAVETALGSAGHVAGAAWDGVVSVETVAAREGDTPQISAGTEEFSGLEVTFSESWTVTGVDSHGELRGTIELRTISRGGS